MAWYKEEEDYTSETKKETLEELIEKNGSYNTHIKCGYCGCTYFYELPKGTWVKDAGLKCENCGTIIGKETVK